MKNKQCQIEKGMFEVCKLFYLVKVKSIFAIIITIIVIKNSLWTNLYFLIWWVFHRYHHSPLDSVGQISGTRDKQKITSSQEYSPYKIDKLASTKKGRMAKAINSRKPEISP